jgi:hypothetical protein
MNTEQIIGIIRASFPLEPLPVRPFWRDGERPPGDIPEEIEKRLAMRSWDQISMLDWRMIGSASAGRVYLDPNTYRYYLPSLLTGGLQDNGDFIQWALEAILPTSWRRRTTGKWWQEFAVGFLTPQRETIRAYLAFIRAELWDSIGPANQQFVVEAEAIWTRTIRVA